MPQKNCPKPAGHRVPRASRAVRKHRSPPFGTAGWVRLSGLLQGGALLASLRFSVVEALLSDAERCTTLTGAGAAGAEVLVCGDLVKGGKAMGKAEKWPTRFPELGAERGARKSQMEPLSRRVNLNSKSIA